MSFVFLGGEGPRAWTGPTSPHSHPPTHQPSHPHPKTQPQSQPHGAGPVLSSLVGAPPLASPLILTVLNLLVPETQARPRPPAPEVVAAAKSLRELRCVRASVFFGGGGMDLIDPQKQTHTHILIPHVYTPKIQNKYLKQGRRRGLPATRARRADTGGDGEGRAAALDGGGSGGRALAEADDQ